MDNTYTLLSNQVSSPDSTCAKSDCTSPGTEMSLSEKRFAATMVLRFLDIHSSRFNNLEYEYENRVVTFEEACNCLYELLLPSLLSP